MVERRIEKNGRENDEEIVWIVTGMEGFVEEENGSKKKQLGS